MQLGSHILRIGAGPVRAAALLLLAAAFALPSRLGAQEGTEVVRGRVFGPDERPIEGALVTVTGAQTQAARTARTNDDGLYTVLFTSGEGEYVVEVRALGFAPVSARASRTGDESMLVVDVALARAPVQLEAINVTAGRRAPPRRGDARSVGGIERDVIGGALFSLDPGDLNALAASVPGVFAVVGANGDSAFSVLGASPEQNNVVVDGSTFGGGSLPPDAIAGARVVTTTFDPARGQFSGGQLAASTRGGSDIFQGTLRGTLAHPQLAWADPAALRPVPRTESANGSVGGPIRKGRAHYFAAFEVRRSLADAYSLLDPRDAVLAQYGLARDTIAALASSLGALGVPLNAGDVPDGSGTDRQSAFVRLDFTPTATTSLSVRADGRWDQRGGAGISALAFPTLGSESRSDQLGVQVSGAGYLGGFLDEFRTYVQHSTAGTAPYLALPTGTVRVGVRREDGREGLTSLRFGGGSAGGNEQTTTKWETTNELSWIAGDSRHRVKFGQLVAVERTSTSQEADQFGTYTYASLAELAANRPTSYTRTLAARERSTNALTGALWVGDEWRAAPALRLQYGLRLDLTQPATTPAYNPEVHELFGLRTDRVPRDVGYSPRVGFSWSPWMPSPTRRAGPRDRGTPGGGRREGARAGGGREGGRAGGGRRPGGFPAAAGFDRAGGLRAVTISGGVGAFRGVLSPSRIAALVDATGLPSTTRRLTCVGEATPIPDWDAAAGAAAEACLDGTAPEEFSSNQPSVQVFSPDYQAPVSWRGNLGVRGLRFRDWSFGLDGTYSLGLNGESGVDLNLRRTPAFALPDEGNRPVFVGEGSIVPATGAVAPGASRITDRYGRVTSLLSDLRSVATQLQLTVSPPRPLFGKFPMSASYSHSRMRAEERGFNGSTAGDPFEREWAPGPMPAHQFQLTTSARLWWLSLGLRLNVQSGTPYTPQVAGDVNGDGASNDRAFVPNPAAAADPALAAEMDALLAAAPERARDCLREQMGRIAGRNSCSTGWHVRPDLNVNFQPPQDLGVGDRLRLSFTMVNASGALFRLLGLSETPLGRAATPLAPDPTLLYVTGFDPATRRFQYRVNQQFGDANGVGRRGRRLASPFQVQLALQYRFGGPPRDRMARNLGLVAEKGGAPLTAEEVRQQLRRLNNNPIRLILSLRDSLRLSDEQTARLEAISAAFTARADSASAPLARYVVERGSRLTDADLSQRLSQLGAAMRKLMLEATAGAREVLTEAQLEHLPPWYFGSGR